MTTTPPSDTTSNDTPSSRASKKGGGASLVDLLSQVELYANDHVRDDASESFKSFFWKLTRARQSRNRGAMTLSAGGLAASDVREYMTASCRVVQNEESTPELVEENDKADDNERNESTKSGKTWSIVHDTKAEHGQFEDPIALFGALPPRELRDGQKHMKATLENYIVIASRAAAVLETLNDLEAGRKENK